MVLLVVFQLFPRRNSWLHVAACQLSTERAGWTTRGSVYSVRAGLQLSKETALCLIMLCNENVMLYI